MSQLNFYLKLNYNKKSKKQLSYVLNVLYFKCSLIIYKQS